MSAAKGLAGAISASILFFSAPAWADISGTISANITLTTACSINGTTTADGTTGVNYGTLSFGTYNTLFTQADAQVTSPGGGTFTVQCSNGVPASIIFDGGQNPNAVAGGTRAMKNGTTYVAYNLYSDSGRTAAISNSATISLGSSGAPVAVQIYGSAYGAAGLIPGTYTDVVTVVLDL